MRLARLLTSSFLAAGALLAIERDAHAGPVTFGVGYVFTYGGNFLDKPTEKKYPDASGQRREVSPSYPGFGGTTSGPFGLAFDARFMGLVGLEIDVIKMSNTGKADIDITSNGVKRTYELEIGHDAWHIPVLLKGAIPAPLFSPFVIIGAEFVRTSGEYAKIENNAFSVKARTDNYTFFTAGLGFEFKLPLGPLPVLESVRIPLSFRGSYYPIGENIEDRAEYNLGTQTITYDTRWKFQAVATLGVQAYF